MKRLLLFLATNLAVVTVLSVVASMIVMAFSRWREYRADAGGARLAGPRNMIGALQSLQRLHDPQPLPAGLAAFGISGGLPEGLSRLFMSHPSLEARIATLQHQYDVDLGELRHDH